MAVGLAVQPTSYIQAWSRARYLDHRVIVSVRLTCSFVKMTARSCQSGLQNRDSTSRSRLEAQHLR